MALGELKEIARQGKFVTTMVYALTNVQKMRRMVLLEMVRVALKETAS
jgi:hypothetical protein